MVHQRAVTLNNHRGLAAVVPHYAFVRYEHLLQSDGTVNEAALQEIGTALGLGPLLAPPSSEPIPHFTYARAKRLWLPWRNFFGLSAMPMPPDRIQYRLERQYMCAYRQSDLDFVNEVLDEQQEEAAGYRLVRNATVPAELGPLHEEDAGRIWPAVAARCEKKDN